MTIDRHIAYARSDSELSPGRSSSLDFFSSFFLLIYSKRHWNIIMSWQGQQLSFWLFIRAYTQQCFRSWCYCACWRWTAYVDTNLVGTGKVSRAAILGQAGGVWAASGGYNVCINYFCCLSLKLTWLKSPDPVFSLYLSTMCKSRVTLTLPIEPLDASLPRHRAFSLVKFFIS